MNINNEASLQKVLDFMKWANEETEDYWVFSHEYRLHYKSDMRETWSIQNSMNGIEGVVHETIQEIAAVLDVLKQAVIKTIELKELNKRANCKMLTKD